MRTLSSLLSPLTLTGGLGLALGVLGCGPRAADVDPVGLQRSALCPGSSTVPGIDVSSYQGSINWGSVAGSGVKWAYAKATEGTGYQDPTFPGNWSGTKANGVLRGAYHFFHPSIDGTAQADYFVDYIGALGAGDLPPMLDWEVTDGVSGSTAKANGQAFIDEVQARTGRSTVVYTSPGLWSGFGVSGMGSNPLWVADYTYSLSSCPELPSGWSSFEMWQWDDMGSVPGISGNVDLDVFNGSLSSLQAFAQSAASCDNPIGHPVGGGGLISGPCGSGTPAAPTVPTQCGELPSGTGLGRGQSVTSCDGRFTLVMQGDGNAVEYEHGNALWSTRTGGGTAGYAFDMQTDGNLVLYGDTSCAMWDSATAGNAGAYLAVQNDGNLVVYTASGKALWSSGTGPIPPVSTQCGNVAAGDGFGPGDSVTSCQGCFSLVMQGDGNLVLYKKGGTALWDTKTNGQGGYAAEMQTDGNFVLYSSGGCPLWDSNTGGSSGAYLAVQDDGNLVVYANGKAVWNSGSVSCAGGCSCLPPPPPDAGPPPVPDAGDAPEPDAGHPAEPDAGHPDELDAGHPDELDAGHTVDSDAGEGAEPDAGIPDFESDAGTPEPDAGVFQAPDSGAAGAPMPDAGRAPSETDAGIREWLPLDAGGPDASPSSPLAAHSAGCQSAGGQLGLWVWLGALPLGLNRRRRRAR